MSSSVYSKYLRLSVDSIETKILIVGNRGKFSWLMQLQSWYCWRLKIVKSTFATFKPLTCLKCAEYWLASLIRLVHTLNCAKRAYFCKCHSSPIYVHNYSQLLYMGCGVRISLPSERVRLVQYIKLSWRATHDLFVTIKTFQCCLSIGKINKCRVIEFSHWNWNKMNSFILLVSFVNYLIQAQTKSNALKESKVSFRKKCKVFRFNPIMSSWAKNTTWIILFQSGWKCCELLFGKGLPISGRSVSSNVQLMEVSASIN
jgi:hypothetical protein